MEIKKIVDLQTKQPYTALLYCPPGVGKSTAIGLIAEASEGNTLVLDIDRTISRTLTKKEVVKDVGKIFVNQIDTLNTFADWQNALDELSEMKEQGLLEKHNIQTIAVDNISELERCILSDLGSQGKNKGVPSMGDYQYMQFKLVNSLRQMKTLGVNIVWTAWESNRQIVDTDGTAYTQLIPKISEKIVDNICGLCDVVGKIFAIKGEDGETKRGIKLDATASVYAKNQIDSRKSCNVEDFIRFEKED